MCRYIGIWFNFKLKLEWGDTAFYITHLGIWSQVIKCCDVKTVFPSFREFPEAGSEADEVIPGDVAGLLHQLLTVRETHRSHVRLNRNSRVFKRT